MGLVRIQTDTGIEGNAFLGSALACLESAKLIVERFKPMLVGRIRWRENVFGARCPDGLWVA